MSNNLRVIIRDGVRVRLSDLTEGDIAWFSYDHDDPNSGDFWEILSDPYENDDGVLAVEVVAADET